MLRIAGLLVAVLAVGLLSATRSKGTVGEGQLPPQRGAHLCMCVHVCVIVFGERLCWMRRHAHVGAGSWVAGMQIKEGKKEKKGKEKRISFPAMFHF